MKRLTTIFILSILCAVINANAQVVDYKDVSIERLIQIVKAEDELRYDKTLEDLMSHPNPFVRRRAALAAGRIGNEEAIPTLEKLLAKDTPDVRQMAAFAIGEIESAKGATAILRVLGNLRDDSLVRTSAIEAAGKIAAANEKDAESKLLGDAILENLKFEARRRSKPSSEVILMGITAVLRAKPKKAEVTIAEFLGYANWRIRADALNTLARLRAKNVNDKAKELLQKDESPIVRAKAARVLGAADDKTAVDLLIKAASEDKDVRVRVNAIRALSTLKSKKATGALLNRAGVLFTDYKKSKYDNPSERNEMLTIASALGNILEGTDHELAIKLLDDFRFAEDYESAEIETSYARISPKAYLTAVPKSNSRDRLWRQFGAVAPAFGQFVKHEDLTNGLVKENDPKSVLQMLLDAVDSDKPIKEDFTLAIPNILSAYAQFKTDDLSAKLFKFLNHKDVVVRGSAATLLGDIEPATPTESAKIYRGLSSALWKARTDKLNDASLAILDALEKQYKNRKSGGMKFPYMSPFISAMGSPDYLIRRKAAEIYKGLDIKKPDPMEVSNPDFKPFEIPKDIGIVKFDSKAQKNGARSRVVRANYRTALSRKNGDWQAVLETQKGKIAIDLFPGDAPLTVNNFIKLAKSGYFNGLEIHRVVPNFVVQDGDPRGDGSGGPGWQIRCEINQIPYKRGMVGMALSGKDTGGSQWFVTHAPQPHLDGGYTIFGKVNENDMKIVDNLVRGDKIISVKIIGK